MIEASERENVVACKHPYIAVLEAAGFRLEMDLKPEGCQLWVKGEWELHFVPADGFWAISNEQFSGNEYPCGNTLETLSDALAEHMEVKP